MYVAEIIVSRDSVVWVKNQRGTSCSVSYSMCIQTVHRGAVVDVEKARVGGQTRQCLSNVSQPFPAIITLPPAL